MDFNNLKKKYSSGNLIKKKSCKGRTIRVENLDVATADRINERVYRSAKQICHEANISKRKASENFSD